MTAEDAEAAQRAPPFIAKKIRIEIAVHWPIGIGREEDAALAVGQAAVDAKVRCCAGEGYLTGDAGGQRADDELDEFAVEEFGVAGLDLAGHAPGIEEGGAVGVGGRQRDLAGQ